MNKSSNKYIFIYATVLVVIVAVVLSVVAMSLKDKQNQNVQKEKMQSLLSAIGINASLDETTNLYSQYFIEELCVNTNGEVVKSDIRPFDIDVKTQFLAAKEGKDVQLPLYRYQKNGKQGYVVPLYGTGLWGAIWGYIALADDFNTIVGITFDHESETPGLGAEITSDKFKQRFINKKINDETGILAIKVCKKADKNSENQVDAISGATITSQGVSDMLTINLEFYKKFISRF